MNFKNVLLLLTPKNSVACLDDSMNVRQAYEKMKAHRFMAVPLISSMGEYLGTITEGDILHCMVNHGLDLQGLEDIHINDILRKEYTPAVRVDADFDTILKSIMAQNFVPVVDDRNILMGIVTRKKILEELTKDD